MTSEHWQQINALLDAVLDLPPGEQQAYLDAHCPDPALRREVGSLLEAHDEAQEFLEEPAKEFAASLIPMTNDLSPDRLVGQEIDGYRILDVLGRGGMGVVYKAHDVNLDKIVALKMIDPALARDEAFLRRFRGEARALARIDSPHIVRVHVMRPTEAGLYIVMEFVDGGTVTDLLHDGPIPWRRALPIIRQMLTALEHAHSVNVIHRDIKPSNIMLTARGEVKVTDFGLAKVRKTDGLATVTQGIAGTLFYMSPEQVEGLADLDHRSDLYSMGLTIYQMLTGRLPLDRDAGDFAVMRAIVEDTMPPPSTFKPDLPEPLVRGVMKALEKDPDRRFQDAAEMREAFDVLVQDTADAETVIGTLPPYRPPRPAPRRALWIGGGVLGVAALILAAFLLWPSAPASNPPQLTVRTNPDGAVVYLEDRTLGLTPIEDLALDDAVEAGILRIERIGYAAVETTLVAPEGESVSFEFALVKNAEDASPDRATLDILSTPGDARVLVNSEEIGTTDASGRLSGVNVAVGEVFVEIVKEGYELWSGTYQVEAGETVPVEMVLVAEPDDPPPVTTAALTLQAVPGGTVTVSGQRCSLGSRCVVTPGDKQIVFRYQGWECRRSLRLNAGAHRSLTCYFERKLTIQVRKEDGSPIWAKILVNNQEVDQTTDVVVSQEPGPYTVAVSRVGFEVLTQPKNITVEPGFDEKLPPLVFQIREQ